MAQAAGENADRMQRWTVAAQAWVLPRRHWGGMAKAAPAGLSIVREWRARQDSNLQLQA